MKNRRAKIPKTKFYDHLCLIKVEIAIIGCHSHFPLLRLMSSAGVPSEKSMLRKIAKFTRRKFVRPFDIHLYQKVIDKFEVSKSSSVEIKNCRAVCLVLGPYRNLTTLTASVMFLHPNCQVLNHGGRRIFTRDDMNFIVHYTPEIFEKFLKFAIQISAGGRKGDTGGSILKSHAFDQSHFSIINLAKSVKPLKDDIHCLFWKESLKTSNLIHEQQIDLKALLMQEPRLRFMLPIRNPIDCALSNLRTGHAKRFRGIDHTSSLEDVLEKVLDEIQLYGEMRQQIPGRFFHFFEHSISEEMLAELIHFLDLPANEDWIYHALRAMDIQSHYNHSPEIIDFYHRRVKERFAHLPVLRAGLLAFETSPRLSVLR